MLDVNVNICLYDILTYNARPIALCHDTMHCIVTKAGKWAIAHPAASYTFFFFFFFFILFHLLEDHKKNFHFLVEPNKFIKIYLFIFSNFTHCKTSEKNFFNSFFFPMCYSPSTQTTQHTQHIITHQSCYAHHSSNAQRCMI